MSPLTKILVVLNLVFSVALSVLVVLMVSRQENYKQNSDVANGKAVALTGQLQGETNKNATLTAQATDASKRAENANTELADYRRKSDAEKGTLEAENAALKGSNISKDAQIASLTTANETAIKMSDAKEKELLTYRPQVAELQKNYATVVQKLNETENQLRAAEQAIRKLEEAAVVGTTSGAAGPTADSGRVQALSTVAAAAHRINAAIVNTTQSAGRTLIEMPLGSRDGIAADTKLYIYRSNGYVADAVVESVTADKAVAVVTTTKQGATVQVGDIVSTLGQ